MSRPPEPDRAAILEGLGRGKPQLLWRTRLADLDTPVGVMLRLGGDRPNSFLFESVSGGEVRGRYSIIGCEPDLIWRMADGRAEINRRAQDPAASFEPQAGPPMVALEALITESQIAIPRGLPPMASGLFGYLGYDMVREVERLPNEPPDALGLPDALFIRPTLVAVFDSIRDEITLVTAIWPTPEVAAERAFAEADSRLQGGMLRLDAPMPSQRGYGQPAPLGEPMSNTPPERYHGMVEAAQEYIRAGDIFQVVLSQRFAVPYPLSSVDYYRSLRRLNPSPFLFHLRFDDFSVVGSSPEILVRLRDDRVVVRPIAGTRRRGTSPEEDKALEVELLADPKERAEHLMLLDLGRNDVGRVARMGTVRVTEAFIVERYSHVMHIVSNVEGERDPAIGPVDTLMAGFPAGTVSGAPKVRAMEIIDELEVEKRGVYGGGIGYFGAGGGMDTCITLRTAVLKDGMLYVQAGAGIVADSVPASEHQECVNKAMALVQAARDSIALVRQTPTE